MNNTFIKMLAAIEDPAAIERAYQMMAAKRELLTRAHDEVIFKHSVMEPRPLGTPVDTACPDMVELKRMTAKVSEGYKLAPSLNDILFVSGLQGTFRLEIHNATDVMELAGFNNGGLFNMESVGFERSTVRSVKHPKRTARIHNRYLLVVFVTDTGTRYRFPN